MPGTVSVCENSNVDSAVVQRRNFEQTLLVVCLVPIHSVFSGDGKPREGEDKPTIYKRNPDVRYNLKLAASKKVSVTGVTYYFLAADDQELHMLREERVEGV